MSTAASTTPLNASSGAFDTDQGDWKERAMQTLQEPLPADVGPDYDARTEQFGDDSHSSISEPVSDAGSNRGQVDIDTTPAVAESDPSGSEDQPETETATSDDRTADSEAEASGYPINGAPVQPDNTPARDSTPSPGQDNKRRPLEVTI